MLPLKIGLGCHKVARSLIRAQFTKAIREFAKAEVVGKLKPVNDPIPQRVKDQHLDMSLACRQFKKQKCFFVVRID